MSEPRLSDYRVRDIGHSFGEDYLQKGVPYISIDQTIVTEAASNYQSIRSYEQAVYYVGQWKAEYDTWVKMLVNIYNGSKRDTYVKIQAQIVDMVLTSPVSHSFRDIKPPTLLIIGEKDKTAIGSQWPPPEVAAKLGRFDLVGPEVAGQLQNDDIPELGHAPQISEPEAFHQVLLKFLAK